MHAYNLLVVCINSPLHYALYDDDRLLESFHIDEKPSRALPLMYQHLQESSVRVGGIYYASGPGNLSALKLTHIFLQSWAIVESIPLYATDSFSLCLDSHIPAFGKKYFTLQNCSQIPYILESTFEPNTKATNLAIAQAHITHTLCPTPRERQPFLAPQILPKQRFCLPCEPLYILPPL
ncbi:hypothetical protein [Helicobacter zhangjianzhongii]|uniref:Uncharacterized protein n=1 Tax=Helicobacter zhangjianzhongii TaxID=2974574 RepID=A0ACC6FT74_9HELI|nr:MULTISPECIES: hypothetical protein [unclassified Helicobacter]MDL0079772.1 hypothetical protein [Helicobacter sp. CPD2-1]MDL0082133.1 hypothetical protein [Helicobacter sp. XJK30-2]